MLYVIGCFTKGVDKDGNKHLYGQIQASKIQFFQMAI